MRHLILNASYFDRFSFFWHFFAFYLLLFLHFVNLMTVSLVTILLLVSLIFFFNIIFLRVHLSFSFRLNFHCFISVILSSLSILAVSFNFTPVIHLYINLYMCRCASVLIRFVKASAFIFGQFSTCYKE